MNFFNSKATITTSIVLVSLSLQLSGCASGSQAAQGAKQGAVQGAAAGAVGGLVSALVFGGDPVDRAARGAVYGGATGATAGAIAGSRRDKQIQAQQQARSQTPTKAQQDAELKALKKEIGKPAFNSLTALADCQHDLSLKRARKAQKSDNPNHRLAGLWLEVLNYSDMRQQGKVNQLLPVIVAEDWDIKTEAQADTAAREASAELVTIRKDYGLPLVCPA